MITIKVDNIDENKGEIKIDNNVESKGQAFVETVNIIKAAIENFQKYDDSVSRGKLLGGITELLRFNWEE